MYRLTDEMTTAIQLAKTDDCAEAFIHAFLERGDISVDISADEDYDSDTVLMTATRANFPKTITCLAAAGWSVDVQDHVCQNPLHEAVYNADQAALALIRLGADVNARDGEGDESVMTKAIRGLRSRGMTGAFPEVMVELLRAGAHPEFPDGGDCLLECIRRSGDADLAARIAPLAAVSSVSRVCASALDASDWDMARGLASGRPEVLRDAAVASLRSHPDPERLRHIVADLGVELREEDLAVIATASATSSGSAD
jgi:hypothetical protein